MTNEEALRIANSKRKNSAGEERDFLNTIIQALEQQPCEDCISRKAVMEYITAHIQEIISESGKDLNYHTNTVLRAILMGVEVTPSVQPQRNKGKWIPVSERLPKDFGTYLITLESGDVCNCEFNPDYIDEEHGKGAFTYYHDYFDNYTFGLIDSEEISVDAIAWMPFEPYKAESEEEE